MTEQELSEHKRFLRRAVELAAQNMHTDKGGPFGAVVVRGGEIVAEGCNQVTSANDPTLHAEVDAIRKACKKLGSFELKDCVIYSSCEPCPMCLGAIYWARPKALYFAADRFCAAKHGFDDKFIYDEIALPPDARSIRTVRIALDGAEEPFEVWSARTDKTEY